MTAADKAPAISDRAREYTPWATHVAWCATLWLQDDREPPLLREASGEP